MSGQHRCVLSLGSNLGDRMAHLQAAVEALPALGVRVLAVSRVYETDAVGGPEQGPFLNIVALAETGAAPLDLLAACHAVEAQHDRRRDVRWGPRTLDIDLIAYDGLRSDDPELTLPHPRAAVRAFVCVPWLDVDPDAVLPEGRVRDLADTLDDQGVVRREDLSIDIAIDLATDKALP